MNEPPPDPRVYFAAERTLLAWVRTGLTVVALGFVVARFGLFLRLISGTRAESTSISISTIIGVGAVILGTASMGVAAWQHSRFIATLDRLEKPRDYFVRWPIYFASLLSVLGLILGGYLLFGPNMTNSSSVVVASPSVQSVP